MASTNPYLLKYHLLSSWRLDIQHHETTNCIRIILFSLVKDIISVIFSHILSLENWQNGWNVHSNQTALPFHIFQRSVRWPTCACSFKWWIIKGMFFNQTRANGKSSNNHRHFWNLCPCDWCYWMRLSCQPFTVHIRGLQQSIHPLERILLQAKSLYSWCLGSHRKTEACQQFIHFWRSSSCYLSMSHSISLWKQYQ